MTSINTTNVAISALYDAELSWGGLIITTAVLAAAAFVIARWF